MHKLIKSHYAPLFFLAALVLAVIASVIFGGGKAGPALQLQRLRMVERTIVENDPTGRYRIDVQYPELRGWADREVQERVNKLIKASVEEEVNEFRTDMTESETVSATSRESVLTVTYAVEMFPTRPTRVVEGPKDPETEEMEIPVLSIRFVHSPYYAGAAHPDGHASGMSFRLDSGEPLAFGELFVAESEALRRLAEFSERDLRAELAPFTEGSNSRFRDQIMSGTDSVIRNYEQFLVGLEGLTILFNPYQVAPYVFGILEVKIPWIDLDDLLRPEWRFLGESVSGVMGD